MSVTSVLKVLAKPFVVLIHAAEWVPKIVTVIRDSETEAKILEPKLVATFHTVESLAKFVIGDGKQLLPALKVLLEDVRELASGGMVDPKKYIDVIAAVNSFVNQVHGIDTAQIVHLVDDLISEYHELGSEVKLTLDKLASDLKAESKPVTLPNTESTTGSATYQYLGIDAAAKSV